MDRSSSAIWVRHRSAFVFGLAFAIALILIFVVWGSQALVDNVPDPYGFHQMGKSIAEGRGFEGFGVVLDRKAPGYPIFVGSLYWLFGPVPILVKLSHAFFFAGTCALASSIGARLFNERTGLIAGLICAFFPSLWRYIPDLHLEAAFTFIVTLSVWCNVRLVQAPSLGKAAVSGLVHGLGALTKAVVLPYPVVFAALWLFFQVRAGKGSAEPVKARTTRQLLVLGVFFAAMGLTIMPWTIRNYHATGGHIVTIGTGAGDAFLRGVVFSELKYATLQSPPYTDAEIRVGKWFEELCKAQGAVWRKDDIETDRILKEAAKAHLLANPLDFVRKFFVGMFTFWYEMTSLKTSLVAGLLALGAWVFASIGLPRAHREKRTYWVVLAPIIFLNVELAVLLALGRYSIPILPCLIVLAAFGVDTLLTRRQARSAPAPTAT